MDQLHQERDKVIIRLYFEGKSPEEILAELKSKGHTDLKDTHSLLPLIARLKEEGAIPEAKPDLTAAERGWLWEIGKMFDKIKIVPVDQRKKGKERRS